VLGLFFSKDHSLLGTIRMPLAQRRECRILPKYSGNFSRAMVCKVWSKDLTAHPGFKDRVKENHPQLIHTSSPVPVRTVMPDWCT